MEVAYLGERTLEIQVPGVEVGYYQALKKHLESLKLDGVQEYVSTKTSLTIRFNDTIQDETFFRKQVESFVLTDDTMQVFNPIDIEVCYHETLGLDQDQVCGELGIDRDELIHLHANNPDDGLSRDYQVAMFGFMPGFAYLDGLDSRLVLPRKAVPRTRVPAGSVAIAGDQTCIYPMEVPGGWRIIGRTHFRPVQIELSHPFMLSLGQVVRFVPIELKKFLSHD
jgi:inhibitor of KinA